MDTHSQHAMHQQTFSQPVDVNWTVTDHQTSTTPKLLMTAYEFLRQRTIADADHRSGWMDFLKASEPDISRSVDIFTNPACVWRPRWGWSNRNYIEIFCVMKLDCGSKKRPFYSYNCSFYKCWPISIIFGIGWTELICNITAYPPHLRSVATLPCDFDVISRYRPRSYIGNGTGYWR